MTTDLEKASEIIRIAEERAKKIIEEAEEKAKKMVSESEILKQVKIEAEKIREEIGVNIKMKCNEAKRIIIDLMKSKDKIKLIEFLQDCSINDYLKQDYKDFENKLENKQIDISKYRYCHYLQADHNFGYCINTIGKMILIKTKNSKQYRQKDYIDKNKIEDNYYEKIELENGRIKDYKCKAGFKLATSYDIYTLMDDVGWLENDKSKNLAEKLKDEKNFRYERLEIHHINNNPNDNRLCNLIWLPRSIHCRAHKYENNEGLYTLNLTSEEYRKLTEFVKIMQDKFSS